jgi:hypothetical protein
MYISAEQASDDIGVTFELLEEDKDDPSSASSDAPMQIDVIPDIDG